MKALSYLLITQIKNKILSLKNKPGMMILYLIIAAFILFSVVMITFFDKGSRHTDYADERIIFLILAGLTLFFVYAFTVSGLSTGSSLFTMPDVGLLFVAPISPKKILLYGLISTLGKSLLGSLFIFYQIGNLRSNFGYGFREIFGLFLVFAIMMMFLQLLAIGIYIFSNGNQMRKNIVKMLLYTLFGIVIIGTLLIQRQEQTNVLETLYKLVESDWFEYLPVVGWATMFFAGVVYNSTLSIILSLSFFFVAGAFIVALLTAGKADYYEDVLLSTEVTYQTRLDAKEGRMIQKQRNKKIKIKDEEVGIGNGQGASALLYKHILELKRKSRFIFVDAYSIFVAVAAGIAAYNFRTKDAPAAASYIVLAVAIYFQYFLTIMGKLKVELLKPYIYLIPEKSFKKVIAASATSLLKPCVDGFIIFLPYAVISGISIMTGVIYAIAYAASGAVFVSMTVLYQRVLGGQPNRIAQAFIGVGLLFAVMSPSIGVSVVAAIFLPETLQFLSMLPYAVFCLMFAALLFITCGNLIDKAEYTGKLN